MSKQIQFTKTGSPDVLQIVDVEILALKANEVQIQIHAIGEKTLSPIFGIKKKGLY